MHHYQHPKNQTMDIFDNAHPKVFESTFSFSESVPACKKSVISYVHFWDTVSFKVSWPDWPHPFMTMPTQKKFDQLLISLNLYQYAKNQFFHLFILQIQSILETCHQTGHTHFWLSQPKNFQSTFDLHEFVPACKKSVNSICSFFRYSQF